MISRKVSSILKRHWAPVAVGLVCFLMALVGVGLLQRAVSLPKNTTVAAGAALGFGHLVYAAATPQMLLRNALGAILGGLLLCAFAGTLVEWLLVPEFRRASARRAGSR